MKSPVRSLALPLASLASAGLALAQPAPPAAPAPAVPAAAPGVAAPPASASPDGELPPTDIDEQLRAVVARKGGLTANEAARRATDTSREAAVRAAEVDAAEAEVDRAAVGFVPRLTLTARYTRLSDVDSGGLGGDGSLVVTPAPPGLLAPGTPLFAAQLSFPVILDQYLLQASVVVPLSDYLLRLSQSYSAATEAREAAALQQEAARRTAGAEARIGYYTWARARLQAVIGGQAVKQAEAHQRDVTVAFEAERASRADVLRAESALASAELLLERAENLGELAEEQLRTRLHDGDGVEYEVGEDLLAPTAPMKKQSISVLMTEALRQRPEIRALDHTAHSLRQQSRAAGSARWPRLDAFGNAYYSNPNQRVFPQSDEWTATWDVGLQLTWSPNDLVTYASTQRALDARAAQIEAQKAQLTDALRAEVVAAYQAARDADAAQRASARGLVAAEEGYRVRRELFRYGRATATEVLDAETELLRARLEHVGALVDARIARVRLDHALGRQ